MWMYSKELLFTDTLLHSSYPSLQIHCLHLNQYKHTSVNIDTTYTSCKRIISRFCSFKNTVYLRVIYGHQNIRFGFYQIELWNRAIFDMIQLYVTFYTSVTSIWFCHLFINVIAIYCYPSAVGIRIPYVFSLLTLYYASIVFEWIRVMDFCLTNISLSGNGLRCNEMSITVHLNVTQWFFSYIHGT